MNELHLLTREWKSELQLRGLAHKVHGNILDALLRRHSDLVTECLESGQAAFAVGAAMLAYRTEELLWRLKREAE
jgi:hypothetical protein